jgi:hypothetical protein
LALRIKAFLGLICYITFDKKILGMMAKQKWCAAKFFCSRSKSFGTLFFLFFSLNEMLLASTSESGKGAG